MLYAVSRIPAKNGMRLVDTDDGAVQDYNELDLVKYINDGGIVLENVTVKDGVLTMFNGSINKMGTLELKADGTDTVTKEGIMILEELVSEAGEIQGYTVANALGEVRDLSVKDVISLLQKYPLINGRLVTEGGKSFIAYSDKAYVKSVVDELDEDAGEEAVEETAPVAAEEPADTPLENRKIKMVIWRDGKEQRTSVTVNVFIKAMAQIGYDDVRSETTDKGIRFLRGMPDEVIKKMNNELVEIELPEGVEIGQNLFANSRKLRRVICQSTEIGKAAFMLCTALKIVRAPTVTLVEDLAFYQCSKLDDFPFPATLRRIGSNAFENCGFEIVDLTNVMTVKSLAFSNNKYLHTISLSKDILKAWQSMYKTFVAAVKAQTLSGGTNASMGVFFNCPALERTNIKAENIKALENFQFKGCTKLIED